MSTTHKLGYFFSDHHRWLLLHVQRLLRNRADAEDTAAETFCQLLAAQVDPTTIDQPRAYLSTIARRLIFDRHRRRRLEQADSLSLITGARVIDWKRDKSSRTLATDATSSTREKENGIVTPYVGLIYDLNENWSTYASYTTIFKPQDRQDVNGTYIEPKEGESYELGIKSEFWDKRLTAGLSVFEVRQDNLAVADGSNIAPNGDQAYRAESSTKTRGFEVEMAGEILPDWQVSASYAYAVIKDSDDERLNTETPRDTLKLFTTYRLQSVPQLKIGGGVRWQGAEYYKNSGPNKETFHQDDYSVVDLMAQYAFTPETSVSLNLNNVLDEHYYTAIGSRGWYGTPRSVTATLAHAF